MNPVLVGVLAYVLLQFAIGAWISRRIFTERDYINAGRQLGLGIAAFSVFATWFGAEVIVGTAGTVYTDGLVGATIDPFGYAAALLIVGATIAAPLWRRGYVTFADFFRERYSPAVERLAIVFILPGTIIWGGAQIRAFGQVMGAVSDVPLIAGIVIATVVVIAYTVLGGLLADAITDFIQAIGVILGLVVLAVVVVVELGGSAAALESTEPKRLAYFSTEGKGPLAIVEEWAIPILSEAHRLQAARGCVIALGLVAFLIALRSTTIHDLIETASSIGSAGLIVVLLFGLFTTFGGPLAAVAALLAGGLGWLLGAVLELTSVPYVAAIGLAAAAYVIVGLIPTRPR
jgi:solute:Na+ symporter, SSS family